MMVAAALAVLLLAVYLGVAETAGILAVLLPAGYLGVSAYSAGKLSRPARNPATHTPAEYGLQYEEVRFNSAGDHIRLNGWFIDSPGTRTIIMLHGRDFSREANGGLAKAAALAGHDYDVLMFDFRAHGASGGDHYALGAWETRDVTGALDYLKSRGVTEVGIYGISMGAATAIMAAAAHPEIKAIVAEAAYSDLGVLIDEAFSERSGLPAFFNPGVRSMAHLLYGIDFSKVRPAGALKSMGDRPVLLIHSTADEFVAVRHATRLQEAGAGNPNLEVWIVAKAAHCDAFSTYTEEYTRRMLAFYDRHLK
jgi:fermentation-respiration switch protein FrsA (DUF1100 family)